MFSRWREREGRQFQALNSLPHSPLFDASPLHETACFLCRSPRSCLSTSLRVGRGENKRGPGSERGRKCSKKKGIKRRRKVSAAATRRQLRLDSLFLASSFTSTSFLLFKPSSSAGKRFARSALLLGTARRVPLQAKHSRRLLPSTHSSLFSIIETKKPEPPKSNIKKLNKTARRARLPRLRSYPRALVRADRQGHLLADPPRCLGVLPRPSRRFRSSSEGRRK